MLNDRDIEALTRLALAIEGLQPHIVTIANASKALVTIQEKMATPIITGAAPLSVTVKPGQKT